MATLAILLATSLVQTAASEPGDDLPGTSDVPGMVPEPMRHWTDPAMGMVFKRLVDVRTIDGSQNNPEAPQWGAAETQQLRIGPADYPDGTGTTMADGTTLPNARVLSNEVFVFSGLDERDQRGLSDYVWQWGQFLDHDITLTPLNASNIHDIPTPFDDPYFQGSIIPFERSEPIAGTGIDAPREYPNVVTAWIDASNVYGSDVQRAAALRTFEGGRLNVSANDLLPYNTPMLENAGGPRPDLFLAGDIRVNEQVGLTAMHTLFVREHNRIAQHVQLVRGLDPVDDDEEIYQTARKIVGAEMQAITYREFLPALLGHAAPSLDDHDYDNTTDPSIALEFSTALYRLGHSMISHRILLWDDDQYHGSLPLRNAYFRPDYIGSDPEHLEHVLLGLAKQRMQRIDATLVDDLRNFLFGRPGHGGLDLAALNIQRSRDHGLPSYNELRIAYGLPPATSFQDVTSNAPLANALSNVYDGDIDKLEAWIGGLSEDHVAGTSVGPLVAASLGDQFTRLRDGDRFFYTADPDLEAEDLKLIVDLDTVTLSDIITWNTDLETVPDNVFLT